MDSRQYSGVLRFVAGTLEFRGEPHDSLLKQPWCWDERSGCYRAPAHCYAEFILSAKKLNIKIEDQARAYQKLPLSLYETKEPRDYQNQALEQWITQHRRGVVVLPTGAGKSYLAMMAMQAGGRSTLIVAPTLSLVSQWYDLLKRHFQFPVGVVGGGSYEVLPLTICTYDSAYLHIEHFGNRFGLVVYDECHHLPGDAYRFAAEGCLAPFRLGLSATPERTDGYHQRLDTLIGPVIHRTEVSALAGRYLADYEVISVSVKLSESESLAYQKARETYLAFLKAERIFTGSLTGWRNFVIRSSQSERGRLAMLAYQEQRTIAFSAPSKLAKVAELVHRHRHERTIIFTEQNKTAYALSNMILAPAVTHHSSVKERSQILQDFSDGSIRVIVTSKVLNEGVDIPNASVGIIVSGNGSVREHVQRLGRILRKQKGKQAKLYELVTEGTSEESVSKRRRQHRAYA